MAKGELFTSYLLPDGVIILRRDSMVKVMGHRDAQRSPAYRRHFASLEVEFTVDDLAATVLDVFPAPDDGDRLRTETA